MKDEIINNHRFTGRKTSTKFDYKTVPHLIQFVTRGNRKTPLSADVASEQYCAMFNVVLFKRKYRQELTQEEEIAIVREARNLPESATIDIVFSGHPRSFFPIAALAYRQAYQRKKPSEINKVQMVLDLISDYDPRRGEEFDWER